MTICRELPAELPRITPEMLDDERDLICRPWLLALFHVLATRPAEPGRVSPTPPTGVR